MRTCDGKAFEQGKYQWEKRKNERQPRREGVGISASRPMTKAGVGILDSPKVAHLEEMGQSVPREQERSTKKEIELFIGLVLSPTLESIRKFGKRYNKARSLPLGSIYRRQYLERIHSILRLEDRIPSQIL